MQFVFQARRVEAAGAVGVVVLDNSGGGSSALFAMSGDGKDDVRIPVLFLLQQDALQLLQAVSLDPELEVTLSEQGETEAMDARLLDSILDKLKGSVQDFLAKQSDDVQVGRHFYLRALNAGAMRQKYLLKLLVA
jgi:PA domain